MGALGPVTEVGSDVHSCAAGTGGPVRSPRSWWGTCGGRDRIDEGNDDRAMRDMAARKVRLAL